MSARPRITVIDHRSANIHSVAKALARFGVEPIVSSDPADLERAEGAVLPGVGAIDAAMRNMNELGISKPLQDYVASGRPLLGVCLGMQLLFPRSDEGDLPGLGLVDGDVVRFTQDMRAPDGTLLKVPHMGWNSVTFTPDALRHPVFKGIPQGAYFYFVHSYYCRPGDPSQVAATTSYGSEICGAIIKRNIVATQFHPEKSGPTGLKIYENFVSYVTSLAPARSR
ncbi:MAG: imidazole glycerol phosphate synthase subunit HisH [Chloroflexi bacterium]|nr:imidazole glycerol phosphate synthase subunit HisH [Chloroflexota bacterium]